MSKRRTPPSPTQEPEQLQSIDPTALANVSGGAARASAGSDNSEVMTALTGILDSLSSLKNNQQSGFGMNEMMMFMMLMGGNNSAPQVVQQQAPGTIGGYAGYTIDGVYYPFK